MKDESLEMEEDELDEELEAEPEEEPESSEEVSGKSRWLVWLVILLALGGAGFLLWKYVF